MRSQTEDTRNEPNGEPPSDLVQLAQRRMPGGVSTNVRLSEGPEKLIVARAAGCRIWTHEGRELTDFVSGFGSVLLGYSSKLLTDAQNEALRKGIGFTATGVAEIEAADHLLRIYDDFDMVRFCATGSEATTAAIALARAATGRRSIAVFADHYHGWHGPTRDSALDASQADENSVADFPVYRLPFADAESCRKFLHTHGQNLACVILEFVMGSSGRSVELELLEVLQEARDRDGFLLIADEVITGFRIGLRGALGAFGASADLAVFGKCLGGGTPIGALVGREDLMTLFSRGAAMHAGTFNGHPLSMASAVALMSFLVRHQSEFYSALNARGCELREGLRMNLARHGIPGAVQGPGAFLVLNLPPIKDGCPFPILQDDLRQRGVRVPPGGRWFLNAAHGPADIALAVGAVDDYLARAAAADAFS